MGKEVMFRVFLTSGQKYGEEGGKETLLVEGKVRLKGEGYVRVALYMLWGLWRK
jgi:hypothetical protein